MDDLIKAEYSNLVKFVKPSVDESDSSKSKRKYAVSDNAQCLSGSAVVLFYKDVTSSHTNTEHTNLNTGKTSTKQQCLGSKPHREATSEPDGGDVPRQPLSVSMLLTSSQNGDMAILRRSLASGLDVDSRDRFGWSALMCAACSGHGEVVSHLLDNGANTELKALDGKTASSIATAAGHLVIVKTISDFKSGRSKTWACRTRSSVGKSEEVKHFYCDICKLEVRETSEIRHQASTVHLFNRKVKAKPHSFLEHSRNKGYQIMRKTGWDGEKGLGSEGQGQKFPVKTVLKRDRACLGSDTTKETAKVTHFGPKDVNAVKRTTHVTERKMSVKTLSKRAEKAKDRKLKQWEKDLRSQFNSNE